LHFDEKYGSEFYQQVPYPFILSEVPAEDSFFKFLYKWLSICILKSKIFILKKDLRHSTASAFAEDTNRNLKDHWERLILFCLEF
jgi:hypothetical protein